MFIHLSRLAKFFLSPENQVFICAILMLPWLARWGDRRWARITGWASLGWILVLFSPLGTLGLYYYERVAPVPSVDAIRGKTALVLGGNTVLFNTRTEQMDWFADSARVQEPLRLFREGVLARLVVSVGPSNRIARRYLSEAESISKWWEQMGVPKSAITVEPTSRNTFENFAHSRALFRPDEEIVLFTSAYHMRRSLAVARKELPNRVIPYPVDFKVSGDFEWIGWDNVTNAKKLIFETVGLLAYRLAGFSS
jgi:uncharacterized SAM-binding protein YcdF (DUF218 family)